jgi:ankyrin repeat protein
MTTTRSEELPTSQSILKVKTPSQLQAELKKLKNELLLAKNEQADLFIITQLQAKYNQLQETIKSLKIGRILNPSPCEDEIHLGILKRLFNFIMTRIFNANSTEDKESLELFQRLFTLPPELQGEVFGHLNIQELKRFYESEIIIEDNARGQFARAILELDKLELDKLARGSYLYLPVLHWAIDIGDISMVQILISVGANIDTEGYFKETALHIAVSNGDIPIIRLLIDNKADIDAKNWNEQTPFDVAENPEIRAILDAAMKKQQWVIRLLP